eukprot:12402310-Prorocentrum_lima.AAC.1
MDGHPALKGAQKQHHAYHCTNPQPLQKGIRATCKGCKTTLSHDKLLDFQFVARSSRWLFSN